MLANSSRLFSGAAGLAGGIPFFVLTTSACFFLSGCLTDGQGNEGGTEIIGDPADVLPPYTTPERTICDPFEAGSSARDRGLVGNILYLTDDQPRYSTAREYIENGTPIQSVVYFDKLFIPTRRWDLGFYTQEGVLVTNQNNEALYEYFGVRLESQLMLGESEPEGWYQLSILSDDGARLLQKDPDGGYSVLVDNDGTHATRLGCGSQPIFMSRNSKIPVVLEYYQGPRFHISMVLLWRPLPDGADPDVPINDPQCGRAGNEMYFNYNVVPSAPTTTYFNLLSRGWKSLENENYYFPEQASNPCAEEDPLLLTGFAIASTTRTSVAVNWATNQPATSMIVVRNVLTGEIIQPPADPTLVQVHSMSVQGLTSNTLYSVQVTSTTAAGQTAISEERAFRTPR